MKPVKQCNHPACRNLIPFDVDYCAQHTHMRREKHHRYDAAREREDKKYRSVYHSSRWRKLRKQILLRDDYMCQYCLNKGLYKQADVVDHIIEVKDDITKAYDPENMQSLCHACHNKKTIEEKRRRTERAKHEH